MTIDSHKYGKNSGEDLMKISKNMRLIIEGTVMEIIRSYKMELLNEPVDYFVPAVWGVKKGGSLDATQKEIHSQFSQIINRIIDLFQFEDINDPQKFAIGFLIKSIFVNKISCMIDGVNNGVVNELGKHEKNLNILNNTEMLESA